MITISKIHSPPGKDYSVHRIILGTHTYVHGLLNVIFIDFFPLYIIHTCI